MAPAAQQNTHSPLNGLNPFAGGQFTTTQLMSRSSLTHSCLIAPSCLSQTLNSTARFQAIFKPTAVPCSSFWRSITLWRKTIFTTTALLQWIPPSACSDHIQYLFAFACAGTLLHSPKHFCRALFLPLKLPKHLLQSWSSCSQKDSNSSPQVMPEPKSAERAEAIFFPPSLMGLKHLSGQSWRVKHLRKHYPLPNKQVLCQFLPFTTQPQAYGKSKTLKHTNLGDSNLIFIIRAGHKDQRAASKADNVKSPCGHRRTAQA